MVSSRFISPVYPEVSPGVMVGHRAWDCRFEHDKSGYLILRSTGFSHPWRSTTMSASCTYCVEESPNPDCNCGIYSLKEPSKLRPALAGTDGGWVHLHWGGELQLFIFGTVVMWGKVVEAEEGYRAQHARMESLIYPPQLVVPSHVQEGKTWTPLELDVQKLAQDLKVSYGVPVIEDTNLIYYWRMPDPPATTSPEYGRRGGVPQYDTKTGVVYRSKSAAGKAAAWDYGEDPHNNFAWYAIIRADPTRFRDATSAEVKAHNKAHPFNTIGR